MKIKSNAHFRDKIVSLIKEKKIKLLSLKIEDSNTT